MLRCADTTRIMQMVCYTQLLSQVSCVAMARQAPHFTTRAHLAVLAYQWLACKIQAEALHSNTNALLLQAAMMQLYMPLYKYTECVVQGQEIHVTSEQIPESSCSHVQPTIELLSHKAAAADAIISHQYGHQQRSCSFHAIAHKLEAWCWLPKYWSHRRDNNSIHLCHQTSWFAQFKLLFWRSMVINMRNPLDMGARVLVSPCMGVLEGLVFLHLGYGKP